MTAQSINVNGALASLCLRDCQIREIAMICINSKVNKKQSSKGKLMRSAKLRNSPQFE